MRSAWLRNILRQQYLAIPRSSSTLAGDSPFFVREEYSSHFSETGLPHVKHLTGIIIAFSPV